MFKELWKNSPQEAVKYAHQYTYPSLFQFLAQNYLENLQLSEAQKAFQKASDYSGILLIKKLQKLNDTKKQKAEIASYFENYDQAEQLYLQQDRHDLAIDLRMKLGDSFQVLSLIQSGSIVDDLVLRNALNQLGDYFYDRQEW
jgi:WD repeat-containing protein 35